MELATIDVGFGGLAVAALALVLSYKERVADVRTAFYAKQVETFGLLLTDLILLHNKSWWFYLKYSQGRDPLDPKVFLTETGDGHQHFTEQLNFAVIYLPDSVADALAEYQSAHVEIAKAVLEESDEKIALRPLMSRLDEARDQVIQTMRISDSSF